MRIPPAAPALIALFAGSALGAQTLRPGASASLVWARVRSQKAATTDYFDGPAFLGQGTLAMRRLRLTVTYLQGTVNPGGGVGGGASRNLVEGSVQLGFRPLDWLTLETGPHARAYSWPGTTERWAFWELRARAETTFVGSAVRGYAELWRVLAANVNVPEAFGHAQGGEVGIILRLARAPLAARVGYRMDHAVLGGGTRLETVDGVVIGVGLRGLP